MTLPLDEALPRSSDLSPHDKDGDLQTHLPRARLREFPGPRLGTLLRRNVLHSSRRPIPTEKELVVTTGEGLGGWVEWARGIKRHRL